MLAAMAATESNGSLERAASGAGVEVGDGETPGHSRQVAMKEMASLGECAAGWEAGSGAAMGCYWWAAALAHGSKCPTLGAIFLCGVGGLAGPKGCFGRRQRIVSFLAVDERCLSRFWWLEMPGGFRPDSLPCHSRVDPPGFALESFDVIGGFRARYRSLSSGEARATFDFASGFEPKVRLHQKVDASGEMPTGEAFQSLEEFQQLVLRNPEALAANMVRQLLMYATGS
jgi:hypothetical protein